VLLRETYREGGKIKKRTLLNLNSLGKLAAQDSKWHLVSPLSQRLIGGQL
jgi:hypothetical protein